MSIIGFALGRLAAAINLRSDFGWRTNGPDADLDIRLVWSEDWARLRIRYRGMRIGMERCTGFELSKEGILTLTGPDGTCSVFWEGEFPLPEEVEEAEETEAAEGQSAGEAEAEAIEAEAVETEDPEPEEAPGGEEAEE